MSHGSFDSRPDSGFGFGMEAEFLLLDKTTYRPLFHQDVPYEKLLSIVDDIDVSDFSARGFNIKPLHKKANPYLIEGYYLTDKEMKPYSLLTKGVELRTPLAQSIDTCVSDLAVLTARLDQALSVAGWKTAIISHHPVECKFEAPPNYTRHDYWQWALTAMTTFGPDINISVPDELVADIDLADFNDKINYYMPSCVAMSLASPLLEGKLWTMRGAIGKSIRTYRRSLWAPMHYIHKLTGEASSLRFEFKGFEMARNLDDYKAFFLMSLAILLDRTLTDRASDQTRIYDLGQIAVGGVDFDFVQQRAAAVLQSAEKIAEQYGFDAQPLLAFKKRLVDRRVPADDIIDLYVKNQSINETMRALADFQPGAAAHSQPLIATAQTGAELCLR